MCPYACFTIPGYIIYLIVVLLVCYITIMYIILKVLCYLVPNVCILLFFWWVKAEVYGIFYSFCSVGAIFCVFPEF